MLQSQGLRAAAGRNPILTFESSANQASTSSATKTVSTSIGVASPDRWVIVLFQAPVSSTARTVSSATINGVSATIGYNIASGSLNFGIAVFFAKVTSGSGSVTITANLSGTTSSQSSRFMVYTLTGRTTLGYSTFSSTGVSFSVNSRTRTLTAPANGFNLNHLSANATPTSPVWSGTPSAPVKQGASPDAFSQVSAYENFFSGAVSVTANYNQSNNTALLLVSSAWTYT